MLEVAAVKSQCRRRPTDILRKKPCVRYNPWEMQWPSDVKWRRAPTHPANQDSGPPKAMAAPAGADLATDLSPRTDPRATEVNRAWAVGSAINSVCKIADISRLETEKEGKVIGVGVMMLVNTCDPLNYAPRLPSPRRCSAFFSPTWKRNMAGATRQTIAILPIASGNTEWRTGSG